ncbi:MAG: DUF302 domain-containing protein [Bacteroidales bacterium]|jgi:uncharacterized protein (DUF302 family)|nr:DUF302 domain-containing protein [Bacteroidales bacterium]
MTYHLTTTSTIAFEDAIERAKILLAEEGFSILCDIDVQSKFKEKLNIDFRRYRILGACNPVFAYKALAFDNKVGTMLPCNVVVQEMSDAHIEISAINPVESMRAIDNEDLKGVASEILQRLSNVINKFND